MVHCEWLGIFDLGSPCGGIADMSYRKVTFKAIEDFFSEYFRHQPHGFMLRYPAAVRGYDAGAFLSTMLQSIEPEISEPCCVRVAENTTDSTFILGTIS